MKVQIRNNVFETNSSSMHSLVIRDTSSDTEPGFLEVINNHTIEFHDGDLDFGRYPAELLITSYDKMRYVVASFNIFKSTNNEPTLEERLSNIVRKYDPEFSGFYFENIEYSNYDDLSIDQITDFKKRGYNIIYENHKFHVVRPYYGYVDHESFGILEDFLNKYKITIEDFIEDPKYIAIIDGDEFCTYDYLLESGYIDDDPIILHYPNYDYD